MQALIESVPATVYAVAAAKTGSLRRRATEYRAEIRKESATGQLRCTRRILFFDLQGMEDVTKEDWFERASSRQPGCLYYDAHSLTLHWIESLETLRRASACGTCTEGWKDNIE